MKTEMEILQMTLETKDDIINEVEKKLLMAVKALKAARQHIIETNDNRAWEAIDEALKNLGY